MVVGKRLEEGREERDVVGMRRLAARGGGGDEEAGGTRRAGRGIWRDEKTGSGSWVVRLVGRLVVYCVMGGPLLVVVGTGR